MMTSILRVLVRSITNQSPDQACFREPRLASGSIDVALSAAHSALSYCGQAFFSEQLDYAIWDKTFGFAYEVIAYRYPRFWPLGRTMYLPWTYYWDAQTKTGRPELASRLWKMNFLGDYSVLQSADHQDLKLSACRNYPVRPVYPYTIDREQIRKLRFSASADFYVNYFVLHPQPIAGLRLGLCVVGDRTSNKVTVYQSENGVRFRANTTFLDEVFREAISSRARVREMVAALDDLSSRRDEMYIARDRLKIFSPLEKVTATSERRCSF